MIDCLSLLIRIRDYIIARGNNLKQDFCRSSCYQGDSSRVENLTVLVVRSCFGPSFFRCVFYDLSSFLRGLGWSICIILSSFEHSFFTTESNGELHAVLIEFKLFIVLKSLIDKSETKLSSQIIASTTEDKPMATGEAKGTLKMYTTTLPTLPPHVDAMLESQRNIKWHNLELGPLLALENRFDKALRPSGMAEIGQRNGTMDSSQLQTKELDHQLLNRLIITR